MLSRAFVTPLLCLPGLLAAQAPRITSAGDPSVADDSIYALAVDSGAFPDAGWVYLFDDGVVRVESDGRTTRTYRQVVQVLSREAAEFWGEWSLTYAPGRERLLVNWVRVRRPDGTLLSDQPVHERESLEPVAQSAPVYTDARVRRLSLGGVAPNTIVDLSYTIELLRPVVPGDFRLDWEVNDEHLVRRSRFLVDLPAGLEPRIVETNLPAPRRTTVAAGRRIHLWAAAEVPRTDPEPFAAFPNAVDAAIHLTGRVSWETIGHWYADLARDRYVLSDSLEQRLAALLVGAATFDDSARALHRWVAQDFRYVSLALGLGGYQPRLPADVLGTRYGDCKDKSTLFIALARRVGWEAVPVLTASAGRIDSTLASLHAFDHVIAALRRDGAWQFTDLTAELVPFGELPPALQHQFGLLVLPDGRTETVTLPAPPAERTWRRFRVSGSIDSTGGFDGYYEESAAGNAQYLLRALFAATLAPDDQQRFARTIANSLFAGASGDSLERYGGPDLAAAPRIAVRVRGGRLTRGGRGTWVLNLPAMTLAASGLSSELEADQNRRYPFDLGLLTGQGETLWEFEVILPSGWQAPLPDPVRAESRFGTYESEYVQDGTRLRIRRRLVGQVRIEPPEAAADLIAWLHEVSRDDIRVLVLNERP
jgi:transglutaminase-like putative cysteine protease